MKENDKRHPFLFIFLLFCLNSLWTCLHYILLLSTAFLALYFDIILQLKLQEFPYTLYPDVLISFTCPISLLSSPQFQPKNIRFTLVFFFYIFIMPLTMRNIFNLCSIYLPICVRAAYRKSGFVISSLPWWLRR